MVAFAVESLFQPIEKSWEISFLYFDDSDTALAGDTCRVCTRCFLLTYMGDTGTLAYFLEQIFDLLLCHGC